MIFALLTLLSALSVAGISAWFSIAGLMSIYVGAPMNAALVMGAVLEIAKLVTTSWLYRNWTYSSWRVRGPLIYFTLALMVTTSIGVFGFLTKGHLQQGAATVDNTAKVERLDQQIAREKSTIIDDERVINQLDTAINSYLGKDSTDKALSVRRSQAPQRKQLRNDIDSSQKKIDEYSEQKLKFTSEVRALQLEVGPIRYISELFYGSDGDDSAKIESAVKLFTLLIVSTLDPLAVILLIAANHSLMRRQDEKKIKEEINTNMEIHLPSAPKTESNIAEANDQIPAELQEVFIQNPVQTDFQMDETILPEIIQPVNEITEDNMLLPEISELKVEPENQITHILPEIEKPVVDASSINPHVIPGTLYMDAGTFFKNNITHHSPSIISPSISRVSMTKTPEIDKLDAIISKPEEIIPENIKQINEPIMPTKIPWAQQSSVLRELLGNDVHFIPKKLNEGTHKALSAPDEPVEKIRENSSIGKESSTLERIQSSENITPNDESAALKITQNEMDIAKYPTALSWIKEFKGE